MPFTWEGCVVKIADTIAYIGRDIEDAKARNLWLDREIERFNKIIEDVKIQNTNLINYFVVDLCNNSSIEDGLKFSDEAFKKMELLKDFNYEKIYRIYL